jgi:DNA (cytosine-5)-methyltransferase 1
MNLQRRRGDHSDYDLVNRFRHAVMTMHPCAFVLENVPFLRNDPEYRLLLNGLAGDYLISEDVFSYADWGAATRRRRLFAIGVEKGHAESLDRLAKALSARRAGAKTVAEAIGSLSLTQPEPAIDHDWPHFRTIEKYADKYASGKYGWYRLAEDSPAPSFGNVMKTYTLRRGSNGIPDRALSPREAIAVLGFDVSYRFPPEVPRTAKYRMAADAVSPVFGRAVAEALSEVLGL